MSEPASESMVTVPRACGLPSASEVAGMSELASESMFTVSRACGLPSASEVAA
jgi:hypothetical protein